MTDEPTDRRKLLQQIAAAATGGFTIGGRASAAQPPVEVTPPWAVPAEPVTSGSLYPLRKGEVGVVAIDYPYGHGLRYGVRTDGVDTTAEIINWRDSISGMGYVPDAYGLLHPRCKAVLPAGVIRVSRPLALLDLREGPVVWGYTIEGEGTRLTCVIYDPPNRGPLMFASNRVYGLTVRNLYFAIPGGAKEQPDWLISESIGKQQFFTFEDLSFDGLWRAGVRLSGVPGSAEPGNCNSEHKYDRLNLGASFTEAFLTDANQPELQSLQFINYWMSNVNMTGDGGLVRLRSGGHITITNLDVSGYQPGAEKFVIDLTETGSNDGAHSLMIRNARFESLSEGARFLRCRWERGNVCIDGYDDIVWRSTTRPTFEIRAGNAVSVTTLGKKAEGASPASAQYSFSNGRFTGVHRFLCRGEPGAGRDNVPASIVYQSCEFCGPKDDATARNIHSFVRLEPDGAKSLVNRPHVRFRACRVEAVPNHVTDWDLGVQGAHASTTAPIKSLRFGMPETGRLPSGGETWMVLPPGAMVLRVTWILPGGRAPSAHRAYRFLLTNGYEGGRREKLAVFEGADFNVASSRVDVIGHDTIPSPIPEGYDAMRASTLVLRETESPGVHPSAQCIVEYI